ncbi:MAG TPA: ATP-binding cassette domain-containing protein [Candidatus Dormibacteraeota bacterium]|nr:ATP-binding cassette domain-containing protein [Candidatus Dormibacteraeota bacterium]
MIEIKNVAKWFGEVVALSGVTATIGPGLTALLGPNGAGKSSLIRIICGLTSPSRGTVRVLDRDPRTDGEVRKVLGLVPQQEKLPAGVKAHEFVAMAGALHGLPDPGAAAKRAIQTVELDPDDRRHLSSYSKGMRQRIKIAQAIVHEPRILVLDEPLNGLDPRQRTRMAELFIRLGSERRCVVVSSHVLEEVQELSSTVLVLAEGKLAAEGDFHAIRQLLDNRPHRIRLRSSDPLRLGSALMGSGTVSAVQTAGDNAIVIDTWSVSPFRRQLPRLVQQLDLHLLELAPLDDDLESVFRYLVARRSP